MSINITLSSRRGPWFQLQLSRAEAVASLQFSLYLYLPFPASYSFNNAFDISSNTSIILTSPMNFFCSPEQAAKPDHDAAWDKLPLSEDPLVQQNTLPAPWSRLQAFLQGPWSLAKKGIPEKWQCWFIFFSNLSFCTWFQKLWLKAFEDILEC